MCQHFISCLEDKFDQKTVFHQICGINCVQVEQKNCRLSDLLHFYMMNINMMKVLPKSNIWERWIINKIYLISQLLLLKCSEIEWRADWHFFYEKELNNVSSKESQTVLRFVNILKSAIKNQMNSNILHLLSQIISTMPSTSTGYLYIFKGEYYKNCHETNQSHILS